MEKKSEILILDSASVDLENIANYLFENFPEYGNKIYDEVIEKIFSMNFLSDAQNIKTNL